MDSKNMATLYTCPTPSTTGVAVVLHPPIHNQRVTTGFQPSAPVTPFSAQSNVSRCNLKTPLFRRRHVSQSTRHSTTLSSSSSNNTYSKTENSDSQSLSETLQSIQDANPIIIGSGPVGSVAAAMLDHRNVQATIVDKSTSFLNFNVSRSYALGIFSRGMKALQSVPGLHEFISDSCSSNLKYRRVSPEKNIKLSDVPPMFTIQYFMRFRLLHLLQSFVLQHTSANTFYGYEVNNIEFLSDGWMNVTITSISNESDVQTFKSKFILACDGKNSFVIDQLKNQSEQQNFIHSKNGFELFERHSPSVGLFVRSLIINNHSEAFSKYEMDKSTSFLNQITIIEPETKDRSFEKQFKLGIFPTVPHDIDKLGGVLAVVVRPSNNELWKVDSVEQAYKAFEENFPQLQNIRSLVPEESMSKFIQQKPGKFPKVSRPESIIATIGDENLERKGSVILVGEASHSFPPDTGQGVNAGFEDVHKLMQLIDDHPNLTNMSDIAKLYESSRDSDLWALMKIARVASPYQYKQSKVGSTLQGLNMYFRMTLNSKFPKFFHPPLSVMLIGDLPYGELLRRADQTTNRILISSLLMITLPLFPVIMRLSNVF